MIPARVVLNWEFTLYPVSVQSSEILAGLLRRPIMNITAWNSLLFKHVPELYELQQVRTKFQNMKGFFLTCRLAKTEPFFPDFIDRHHYLDSIQLYTLLDLIDLHEGTLLPSLHELKAKCEYHIRNTCKLCQNKGFFCELCKLNKIIYPFDANTTTCTGCMSVFHISCFSNAKCCPKCTRVAVKTHL